MAIKSGNIIWMVPVVDVGEITNTYKSVVGNLHVRTQIKWQGDIKMNLRKSLLRL